MKIIVFCLAWINLLAFAQEPARTAVATEVPTLFIVHLTKGAAWDTSKSASEQPGFAEHGQNLTRMRNEGLLVVGARYQDGVADKGMLILRASSRDEVSAALARDPMIRDKRFALDIAEFKPFFDGVIARPKRAVTGEGLAALAWMAGCWAGERGKATFREQWMKPAGGVMLGMAYTLSEGKLINFEHMRVELGKDGIPAFTAKPSGQSEGTFKLSNQVAQHAIFENLEHDFPQRVIYRLTGSGELHARIEGNKEGKTRGIDFPMQRAACD